jgi:hypothetical protein
MKTKSRLVARCVLAGLVVLGLAVIVTLVARKGRAPDARRIVVTVGTNGTPVVLGIPLANTNVRDAVFHAMGDVGLKGSLRIPSSASPTRVSNLVETLMNMSRAGLLPTNKPPSSLE